MTCKYDKYNSARGEWLCTNPNAECLSYGPKCEPSKACYDGDNTPTDLMDLVTAANEVIDAYTGNGITPKHITDLARALGAHERTGGR